MATQALKRRPHPRRRRFVTIFLVLLIGLGAIGSVYAWRMVNAIVHAERTAVYPLPPRNDDVALNEQDTTPAVSGGDQQPQANGNGSVTGQQTPAPLENANDPAGPADVVQIPTGDDPSRISVVQDLISASVTKGDPGTSSVWGGKPAINIMLLGVDKRPDGGDQNADAIIIAHVDLLKQRVAAVSIPRDLLVDIPGVGQDKINSAYNYGMAANPESRVAGAALMRDTIESVFGVYIDGYILVDFAGFTDVIDAMGGVNIDVPDAIVDEEYPTEDYSTEVVRFQPGLQHMDGDRALKYVRTRHQDSDDGRRERQLQVLRAMFDKAKSFSSISNGFDIITALGGSVQTSFYLEQQLTLAQLGYAMSDGDIQLNSLGDPLIWGGYTDSGAWVYFSDPLAVRDWVTESLSTDVITADAVASPTAANLADTP